MHSISNPHKRIRVYAPKGGKKRVDPSFANELDINNIMTKYAKTGVLPHFPEKTPQYGDVSSIPTLIDNQRLSAAAQEAFMKLPATLRKLIDNDPSKLELFISDPTNQEICLKYGLLAKREIKEKTIEKTPKKESKNDDKSLNSDNPSS